MNSVHKRWTLSLTIKNIFCIYNLGFCLVALDFAVKSTVAEPTHSESFHSQQTKQEPFLYEWSEIRKSESPVRADLSVLFAAAWQISDRDRCKETLYLHNVCFTWIWRGALHSEPTQPYKFISFISSTCQTTLQACTYCTAGNLTVGWLKNGETTLLFLDPDLWITTHISVK